MSFTQDNLANAISHWKDNLNSKSCIFDQNNLNKYLKNEIRAKRKVSGALFPLNTEEVSQIIKVARKYKIPLYPISTGNNWGYGAATPVADDCVVIDLSKMNRIIEMDEDLGLVTVEPGVTPKQLRDYLDEKKSSYLVPVSGAGPNSSLLGNALERGYGITPYADHFLALTSLEAVLPDGSIYRSALKENGADLIDKTFKWGIGPYMDGIFTQSNFGIVTRITIALAPIPEKIMGFVISLKSDACLEESVKSIREILKSVGNITGSINLMNARRVLSMVESYPLDKVKKGAVMSEDIVQELMKKNMMSSWTIGGMIYGKGSLLNYAKAEIKKSVSSIAARKMFFTRGKINLFKKLASILPDSLASTAKKQLSNLDDAFNVAEGAPTDVALKLCYWKLNQKPRKNDLLNPAQDNCGVIWYSPLVPMKPDRVRIYVEMVNKVCISHGIEPLITLTSFSPRCFDSTVPILFDPNDLDETSRAKTCYEALFKEGQKEGFLPYRVGIDHMNLIIKKNTPYWELVSKVKSAIDPDGIISPGRYCPL